MAWAGVNAAGRGTSQSPGTRARCGVAAQVGLADAPAVEDDLVADGDAVVGWTRRTVPAKSMPGIIGQRRTTGDEPVSASPSL